MLKVNKPNLFLITGQPGQGKTTLSRAFAKSVNCRAIHTDDIYVAWLRKYAAKFYKYVRGHIFSIYPKMTEQQQIAWNEYLLDYVSVVAANTPIDLVVDGWLLLKMPPSIKTKMLALGYPLEVLMRKYAAHFTNKVVIAKDVTYKNVIDALRLESTDVNGLNTLNTSVKYQTFDNVSNHSGSSDSTGKFKLLSLPGSLRDARVLDVGCGTGYFSIRCAELGADVTGVDKCLRRVQIADEITKSVYRLPGVAYYHCDIQDFSDPQQFDYALVVGVLPHITDKMSFFKKLGQLIKPGGQLLIESGFYTKHDGKKYITVDTLRSYTWDFDLAAVKDSIKSKRFKVRRKLLKFVRRDK